jgi:hypothetical protein
LASTCLALLLPYADAAHCLSLISPRQQQGGKDVVPFLVAAIPLLSCFWWSMPLVPAASSSLPLPWMSTTSPCFLLLLPWISSPFCCPPSIPSRFRFLLHVANTACAACPQQRGQRKLGVADAAWLVRPWRGQANASAWSCVCPRHGIALASGTACAAPTRPLCDPSAAAASPSTCLAASSSTHPSSLRGEHRLRVRYLVSPCRMSK